MVSTKFKYCIFSFLTILIFIPFNKEVYLLPIIYALHFVFILYIAIKKAKGYKYFILSPHFIFFSYILLNYSLGSLLLNAGISMKLDHVTWFKNTTNHFWIYTYNVFCFMVIFATYNEKYFPLEDRREWRIRLNWIAAVIIFTLCFFVSINASVFGGNGDLTIIAKYTIIVLIVGWLAKNKRKFRGLFYLLIIGALAATSYSSKREPLMVIFFISIFEYNYILQNLKSISRILLYSIGGGAVIFIFVISMSIMRGYGSYSISSYTETFKYIPDYISNPGNIAFIAANLELTQSYYDSNKPIDFILNDPEKLSLGSNYLKTILLPVPRAIFPDKPLSAMRAFTKEEDVAFFSKGGSLPMNPMAEAFWSFHFMGTLMVALVFILVNKLYNVLRKELIYPSRLYKLFLLVFLYGIMFMFFRGSGLDLFVIYTIFYVVFYLLFSMVTRPKKIINTVQV